MVTLAILVFMSIPALWISYVFGIQAQRGGWWRLFYPVTVFAFILDIALNYTLLSLITWDWPREQTFSRKLERLIKGTGWRRSVALWVADVLLDPFDPTGPHIRKT